MQKCMQYDRTVDRKKQRGTEKGQGKPTPKSSQAEARGSAKTTAGACGRCGYPCTHGKCPATDKECIRCHKRGHFAKVCRSQVKPSGPRKLHTGDAWSSDEEYAHLVNAVTDRDAKSGRWWAVVKIDNAHSVKVQLDTGVSKSLLPYNLFRKMNIRSCPQPSSHRFQSYTGHPIRVEGSVILPVEDWFNTYLAYLQCVSRCTSVRSILGHIDVLRDDGVHVRTS